MRKNCLLALIALVVVAGCGSTTPTLEVERGLRLGAFVAGDYTYDVWSYGKWVYSKEGGVHVSTMAPTYDLVLAIQPKNSTVKSIQILGAFVVDDLGKKTSVLDKIIYRRGNVESQTDAAIKSPYAAFIFDSLLDSNNAATLEIEFRTNLSGDSETTRQSLEIQGYEKKTRSTVFRDFLKN